MKKKILALFPAVVMVLGIMPVFVAENELLYDSNGDGKLLQCNFCNATFAMQVESKTILKTDSTVSADSDVVKNTYILKIEFCIIYDNERSHGSADNVDYGDGFEVLNCESFLYVDEQSVDDPSLGIKEFDGYNYYVYIENCYYYEYHTRLYVPL